MQEAYNNSVQGQYFRYPGGEQILAFCVRFFDNRGCNVTVGRTFRADLAFSSVFNLAVDPRGTRYRGKVGVRVS